MIALLFFCAIGLVTADNFKLQVDDSHGLWCDGKKLSTGNRWNQVYTASTPGKCATIALFAENTNGGPHGILFTMNGKPTGTTGWKCIKVASLAAANSQKQGWFDRYYDTTGWGAMKNINGPTKSFKGGEWMWAQDDGKACICRLHQGSAVALQVDDNHKLYDAEGQVISSGTNWLQVHKTAGFGPFALYAHNAQGAYGIYMTVDGTAVDGSKMRCRPVEGTEAEIDAAYPDWKKASVDGSDWGVAEVSKSAMPNNVKGGTKAMWGQCRCSAKVICKITV